MAFVPDIARLPIGVADPGGSLPDLIERLDGADRLTEQAFLEIGEQVRDGRRQSLELVRQAEVSPQTGEAESAEQIVARLQLLTERAAMWQAEAHGQSEAISAILATLARNTDALSLPLRGLDKVVKTLQALRVATRIEAARSHGHGALVLGQELHGLVGLVQEKLALIGERCEVLATLCRRATELEARTQSGPLRDADSEIRRARGVLGSVALQCVRTADHASGIQRRAAGLAENFGELVAALQFQDITRQRLQHIRDALREVADAVRAAPDAPHAVGEICLLQYDQLQWAVEEFCAAVTRLDGNLRAMSDGAQALAGEACTALFAESDEQCAGITAALQGVTASLEKVQTNNLAAGQAIFAVCQAVRDVALLSVEVEQLGEEMQLLAQNAAVSAAHGQVRAAGLTVIATNIQGLSEEAGRYSLAMADRCRQVSEQAEALGGHDQDADLRGSHLETLLEEARMLIARLDGSGRRFDARIADLRARAAGLGEMMAGALDGLEVRRYFLALIEPVCAGLADLAGAHGISVHDEREAARLDRIQSRYTMMSERDVHQRFLSQHGPPSVGATGTPGTVAAGDLGSNVELF